MKEYMLFHIIALFLGVLLDQIVGDPHSLPHPVRGIGRLIAWLEGRLLGARGSKQEDGSRSGGTERTKQTERRRGALLWWLVILIVGTVTALILVLAYQSLVYLGLFVEMILVCYILAARSLCRESMAVQRRLMNRDVPGARHALSMIVGRDTEPLSEEEIVKAAVETVAENTSDGVIAPLLYTIIGGPVLGLCYKAVNTMDSMLGYQNDRYRNFGRFAAKADDLLNYIPSRLSALAMIFGCRILGLFSGHFNGKEAHRIWVRDRRNHSSPNSAQTESVTAGALGLRLGGTHTYQGIPVEKPYIGDERRKAEPEDIRRSNRLMFMTEAVVFVLCMAVMVTVLCCMWV